MKNEVVKSKLFTTNVAISGNFNCNPVKAIENKIVEIERHMSSSCHGVLATCRK